MILGRKEEGHLQAAPRFDILEHVVARGKFHDNRQVIWSEKHLVELHDVGMQQSAVVQNLPAHILQFQRIILQGFHSRVSCFVFLMLCFLCLAVV